METRTILINRDTSNKSPTKKSHTKSHTKSRNVQSQNVKSYTTKSKISDITLGKNMFQSNPIDDDSYSYSYADTVVDSIINYNIPPTPPIKKQQRPHTPTIRRTHIPTFGQKSKPLPKPKTPLSKRIPKPPHSNNSTKSNKSIKPRKSKPLTRPIKSIKPRKSKPLTKPIKSKSKPIKSKPLTKPKLVDIKVESTNTLFDNFLNSSNVPCLEPKINIKPVFPHQPQNYSPKNIVDRKIQSYLKNKNLNPAEFLNKDCVNVKVRTNKKYFDQKCIDSTELTVHQKRRILSELRIIKSKGVPKKLVCDLYDLLSDHME